MKINLYAIGPTVLCLMLSAGCTPAPPLPAPTIISAGCPKVTSCPIPGSQPQTHGDLSADIRRLEAALLGCGLQVEAIRLYQEQQDAET
ncbi:Rz1-like lysis system protein LysC [Sodalis sp. RH19]|uniref:Rz1-like lysis system protein LysC n=1 Tax=Sodalis sp. RH19 TaxID=3394334 RepID=UPI0039B66E5E